MAASAGGALQTGQRIGSAIGAAALAGCSTRCSRALRLLRGVGGQLDVGDPLGGRDKRKDYPLAVSITIGGAALAITVALGIGIAEWRAGRYRPAPVVTSSESREVRAKLVVEASGQGRVRAGRDAGI